MRLFKYFGPARMAVLEDRLIRFSQPAAFNDPFEFLPNIHSIKTPEEFDASMDIAAAQDFTDAYEALDSDVRAIVIKEDFQKFMSSFMLDYKGRGQELMEIVAPHAQSMLFGRANESIGIFCLSEKCDDLLMWAHYADSHKGFVVEFDSDSSFFHRKIGIKDSLREIRKVYYSEARPAITLSQATDEDVFLTKSSHWSYEAEWRMLLPLSGANKTVEVSDDVIYLFEVPKEAIRSIIFGSKMPEIFSGAIIQKMSSVDGFEHVKFYQAKIHPTHYSLDIEAVSSARDR